MHNETTETTEIAILDRAIKARARRDRDGKKRRPVVDGLIEYAESCNARAISAEASSASLRLDTEVLRDVIGKQSAVMHAMEAEISRLNAQIEEVRNASAGAVDASEQADA